MRELKECRICLSEENEKDIITPCDCKGSIKYVHKACLQKWVDVKGSFKCDICKRDYNKFQKVNIMLNNFMRSLGIFLLMIMMIPIIFALVWVIDMEKLKKLKSKRLKRRLKKMRRRMRRREQAIN